MVKTIRKHSMIQIFFNSGMNFLKIRSETKEMTAIKKLKPINIPDRLMVPGGNVGFFSNNNTTAVTRKIDETMFNGVSFNFNLRSYLFVLNFFFFQAGVLSLSFSLAAAAIAAACFFSWKAPLNSGSSLRF